MAAVPAVPDGRFFQSGLLDTARAAGVSPQLKYALSV